LNQIKKMMYYALTRLQRFGNAQNASERGWWAFLLRAVRYGCIAWVALFVYNSVFPPVSTLMLGRLLTFQTVQREWVPIDDISPKMYHAVIAAEDGKFCMHHGVDWSAMSGQVTKLKRKLEGKRTDDIKGASTITMQTVKNLMLWNGRSYLRKALELPLALVVDALWTKKHLMERYLNVAEFGEGVFGVEAASQYYFHKKAAVLNAHEAALLAALLPNPTERNAAKPSRYVASYARDIQRRASMGVFASCVD
jgi:monofunctional biosynthetic peptidoglycan transglycosylase